MSPAQRKAREVAADRYYEACAEWQEVCTGLAQIEVAKTVQALSKIELKVTVEDGWRMAMNLAEQGGVFTALEFRNRAPSALLWFSTLPEWQRKDYVDAEEFEAALDELEYREAMALNDADPRLLTSAYDENS